MKSQAVEKLKKVNVIIDAANNEKADYHVTGTVRTWKMNSKWVLPDVSTYESLISSEETKWKDNKGKEHTMYTKKYREEIKDHYAHWSFEWNVLATFYLVDAKTGQGLAGAKIKVTDKNGKEVMSFVSKEDGVDITGKLSVGETYTFTEISAPRGYKIADPVKLMIEDTSEVQKVTMKDEKIPDVPHVPQTGKDFPVLPVVSLIMSLMVLAYELWRTIREKK